MAVYRVERTRDYTVMCNYHLKDKALSLKAKGVLSMMLSMPEEWNYSTRGLAAICKEGVEAVGNALKELEKAGYMVRRQLRGENGRITDTEYIIYEKPQEPDAPDPDTAVPDTASPYTGNPDAENRPELNIKKSRIKNQILSDQILILSFPPAPRPRCLRLRRKEGMKFLRKKIRSGSRSSMA